MDTLRFPVDHLDGSFHYETVRMSYNQPFYDYSLRANQHNGGIIYECPCGQATLKPTCHSFIPISKDPTQQTVELFNEYFRRPFYPEKGLV